eukprot:NODE_422_length_8880_cov_0.172759.p3 type:complete len:178 gc:universal NODE_422_length_8880_cov_0.172759:4024-4557(+)
MTYFNILVSYESIVSYKSNQIIIIDETTNKILAEMGGAYDEIYRNIVDKTYKPMLSIKNKASVQPTTLGGSLAINVKYEQILLHTKREASTYVFKLLNPLIEKVKAKLREHPSLEIKWYYDAIKETSEYLNETDEFQSKALCCLNQISDELHNTCTCINVGPKIQNFLENLKYCKKC